MEREIPFCGSKSDLLVPIPVWFLRCLDLFGWCCLWGFPNFTQVMSLFAEDLRAAQCRLVDATEV